MKRIIASTITVFTLFIVACSIQQHVKPVPVVERSDEQICLVEDKTVRESFLPALRTALEARGLAVSVVASVAEARSCPIYATYMANWRWDLAMYLAYVKITVYKGTTEVGSATYDALLGGGRPDKFIDAETKTRELVNALFP